jgi:putative FmdB family regulatory protein
MPIYEYKCSSCGHQQESLQKVSDAPLTRCTKCGQETFTKMVTAAGFHLKGSGWYATDFKGGGAAAAAKTEAKTDAKPDAKPDSKAQPASTESKSDSGKEAAGPACGAGACPACR